MSITLSFTVSLNDEDYDIIGFYTPEEPSQTSGPPERCYEGSPDEFEIDSVKRNGVECLLFSPEDTAELIDLALEKAREEYANFCQAEAASRDDYEANKYDEGP